MPTEVVIDRRVLAGFQRRAFVHFPLEHLEDCLGRIVRGRAEIHAIVHRDIDRRGKSFVEDQGDDAPDRQRIGTVHTHPHPYSHDASGADVESAHQEGEQVIGVCAIRKTARRRFVSWNFYDAGGKRIPLVISE